MNYFNPKSAAGRYHKGRPYFHPMIVYGFRLIKEEQHENMISFSPEGLVDYLVTQSNVIAVVEGGRENIGDARAWLRKASESKFKGSDEEQFIYNAPIRYLRRAT